METLYRSKTHWNQYRSASARAPWWDYGRNGIYFVTICTHNKAPFFGTIQQGKLQLSPLGKLAKDCWQQIPQHTLEGVRLSAFIVMPNHIHGIIILDRTPEKEPLRVPKGTVPPPAGPIPPKSNPQERSDYFRALAPKKGSLPYIVRAFKSAVTKLARDRELLDKETPLWQERYYDRVVRHAQEQQRIEEFIQDNVKDWKKDDYHLPSLSLQQMNHPTLPSIQGVSNTTSGCSDSAEAVPKPSTTIKPTPPSNDDS